MVGLHGGPRSVSGDRVSHCDSSLRLHHLCGGRRIRRRAVEPNHLAASPGSAMGNQQHCTAPVLPADVAGTVGEKPSRDGAATVDGLHRPLPRRRGVPNELERLDAVAGIRHCRGVLVDVRCGRSAAQVTATQQAGGAASVIDGFGFDMLMKAPNQSPHPVPARVRAPASAGDVRPVVPRWALVSAVGAPVSLLATTTVAAELYTSPYDPISQTMSVLAATGSGAMV